MKLVRKAFPVQSPIGVPVNHKWDIYERYMPHVLALHTIYLGSKDESNSIHGTAELADLLCDAGYYMWDRNMVEEGMKILDTADKICRLPENLHLRRLRANIGVAIGSLLNDVGISVRDRATQLFDDILVLRQETIAELPKPHSRSDQLLLSNGWNDKGWMCMEREDYAAAEECYENSLAIKRQWAEKEIPFEFAETLKNIAVVRLAQKRSQDALNLVLHATKLSEDDPEMGPDSAAAQKFRVHVAEVMANSGMIQEALDITEKVAVARQKLYGPHHPYNLDVCYMRGALYSHEGRLLDAKREFLRSLKGDLGEEYPQECRARSHYALSEILARLGEVEEAKSHRDEAFRLLEQWRHLFKIEVDESTHESVLFDHIVATKCFRISVHGKLWAGQVQ